MLTVIVTKVQKVCNMVGREEYNIGRIVLSVSILKTFTEKSNI